MRVLGTIAIITLLWSCNSGSQTTSEGENAADTTAEVQTETPVEQLEETHAYDLLISESKFQWIGSKPTEDHTGEITAGEGVIGFNNDRFMHGIIRLNMDSITVTDIENAEYNAKLVNHLKSQDFFDVANHPFANLTITEVGDAEGEFRNVQALLAIKGIELPVEIVSSWNENGDTLKIGGQLEFDRTQYEIKFKSKNFFENLGDNFIKDNVQLDFEAVFLKSGSI